MNSLEQSQRKPGPAIVEDKVWSPRSGQSLRVIGAGAYVAPHKVTAKDIARAFPGWPAEHIVEKTGSSSDDGFGRWTSSWGGGGSRKQAPDPPRARTWV